MEKLSKTQLKVLEYIKQKVENAKKSNNLDEYLKINNIELFDYTTESYKKMIDDSRLKEQNGIVNTIGINSRTLLKLEKYGYISIIYDGKNNKVGMDTVQLLINE